MSLLESELQLEPLVESADHNLPVWKVWKLMKSQKRRFLPLVDKSGLLIGVVRGRDLATLTALSPGSLNINDVLDSNPLCVELADSISKLVNRLTSSGMDYAVIVGSGNIVLEIVTVNQVLHFTDQVVGQNSMATVFDLFQWRSKNGDY
ncbi:MAG: CBS domain-containing protein [Pseudomonadota bacterium]